MSNHNFEDRFFKTRRILELTIFFFLAFSLLSFSYALEPIASKDQIINNQITNSTYITKPVITNKELIVQKYPTITAKDADTFNYKIPNEQLNLLWRLNLPYFTTTDPISLIAYEDIWFPTLDLKSYIYNHKNREGILDLDSQSDGLNCELDNYNLICDFDKDLFGTKFVNIKTIYEDSNILQLILDIKNTPDIKPEVLSLDNTIHEELIENTQTTFDLRNYIDFGILPITDYTIKINTPAAPKNTCTLNLNQFSISCIYDNIGLNLFSFNLNLEDINFSLPIPFTFNILPKNKAPKYIGNLDAGETHLTNYLQKDFNMLELFEDEDSELTFSSEQSSGTFLAQCNPNGNIYSCTFNGNGYADIRFKAYDGEYYTYSPYYRVALVNPNDFVFEYNFDTNFKIVDTLAFDLPLKLKDLNFDVYDLNISINNGLGNNQTFYFDLLANETEEFVFEDLNTNNSLQQETTYPIAIKINGVEVDEIKVLSIPYEPNFLKNYLSVESYTPGDFIDYGVYGHHEVLPGFIFGIPYMITSNFDVPIELYVCQAIPKYSLEQNYKLFKKENENYNLIPENYFCEKRVLNEKTNVVMYVRNLDDYAIVQSLIISKTKIIPPTSLSGGFFNYLNNNLEIVIYTNDVLSFYDFTEYVYSFIPEQSYGNNLNKNTEYNINVEFINGYAYEIVNVPVGIQASRSEVIPEYFDETNYYKITSDIKYIDLNYNKGSFGSNINSSKTETFTFKTKDSSYDGSGPPWYKIASGTFLNNNFEKAGTGSKTFNIN